MRRFTWLFTSLLILGGCNTLETIDEISNFFVDPDVEPIEGTLVRSLPLAFAGQMSQKAVIGTEPDFVTIVSSCNAFPCTSVIKFKVGETGFPWFALPSNTTVTVAGLWTSPQQGLLSVLFTINTPGSLKLIEVRTFPIQENFDGNLIIATGRIDINGGSGPLLSLEVTEEEFNLEFDRFLTFTSLDSLIEVTQEVWMIEIMDNGTEELSDDIYSLTGAGQFATVAQEKVMALQIAALFVEVSANCLTNPINGDILIQMGGTSGDTPQVGQAQLEFTGNCNATVKVNIATGSYVGAFGKNIGFNILD
jgi:hypothetical protein